MVSAGIDPGRPLDVQTGQLLVGLIAASSKSGSPGRASSVSSAASTRATADCRSTGLRLTLDGGCGRGGTLAAGRFGPDGRLPGPDRGGNRRSAVSSPSMDCFRSCAVDLSKQVIRSSARAVSSATEDDARSPRPGSRARTAARQPARQGAASHAGAGQETERSAHIDDPQTQRRQPGLHKGLDEGAVYAVGRRSSPSPARWREGRLREVAA